jgi:hypothetical protein
MTPREREMTNRDGGTLAGTICKAEGIAQEALHAAGVVGVDPPYREALHNVTHLPGIEAAVLAVKSTLDAYQRDTLSTPQ